jgi:thioredoxin-related protein
MEALVVALTALQVDAIMSVHRFGEETFDNEALADLFGVYSVTDVILVDDRRVQVVYVPGFKPFSRIALVD